MTSSDRAAEAYESWRKDHPDSNLPPFHKILDGYQKKLDNTPIRCDICENDFLRTANDVIANGSVVSFSVGWAEWDDCMSHGSHSVHVCNKCLIQIPWLDRIICPADRAMSPGSDLLAPDFKEGQA